MQLFFLDGKDCWGKIRLIVIDFELTRRLENFSDILKSVKLSVFSYVDKIFFSHKNRIFMQYSTVINL